MDQLFAQFVKERRFLKNVTSKTVVWYQTGFKAFMQLVPNASPATINKQALHTFIIGLRERGIAPVTCNTYAKAVNAFLKWLHDEGHVKTLFVIPPQRVERRILQVLTEPQLRTLITFKPKTKNQQRVFTLASLLVDTGIRIEEALTLRMADIDLDNLLVKVRGKGRKERIVPFSPALRRVLFLWLKKRSDPMHSDWLFPTSTGNRISVRNACRAHHLFLDRLGLPRCGFHRLRHTFATSYLRNGGDVVRLSRVLGHSQITTTMRYLHLQTEDLQRSHQQISILERLSR